MLKDALIGVQAALGSGFDMGKQGAFQVLGLVGVVLHHFIMWSPTLIVTAYVGLLAWKMYKESTKYWVEAAANEWMVVLEDGKMKKCGIGLQTWVLPHQNYAKFPSTIEQIEFAS